MKSLGKVRGEVKNGREVEIGDNGESMGDRIPQILAITLITHLRSAVTSLFCVLLFLPVVFGLTPFTFAIS